MTTNGGPGIRLWSAPGYENAVVPEREPQIWTDAHGNDGSEYAHVRTLVPSVGYAHVTVDQEVRLELPAGSQATVLYVNPDAQIIGVEFHDEGNAFGNLAWDAVEIVNDKQS